MRIKRGDPGIERVGPDNVLILGERDRLALGALISIHGEHEGRTVNSWFIERFFSATIMHSIFLD